MLKRTRGSATELPPVPETDATGRVVSVPVTSDVRQALLQAFAGSATPICGAPDCCTHRRITEVALDSATGLMKPAATSVLTEEQRYADNVLHSMGYTVETGADGSIAVRMPEPPAAGNAELFRRTDEQWFRLTGSLRQALDLSTAPRAERAATLARHGALTPRELEHLRYLADAANPIDGVDDGQQPISPTDAQAAVATLSEQQPTSPRSGWSI